MGIQKSSNSVQASPINDCDSVVLEAILAGLWDLRDQTVM